jgi:hypothetical protein
VVALDVGDVAIVAARVRQWLLDRGVAAMNTRRDSVWQPSELAPGSAWRTAVAHEDQVFETLANNGIDIYTDRIVHDPGGNLEAPSCPACGSRLSDDEYVALVEPWLAGGEPVVRCDRCGDERPLGDWDAPWGLAIGAPAVRFNNWGILSEEFLDEVRRLIGGRTFVVRGHH